MGEIKSLLKAIIPRSLLKPFLPSYHWLRAVAATYKYGHPAKNLKVIAVTGTNGKTTTAHYIDSVLKAAGMKVCISTTARFMVGEHAWDNDLNMTVTDPYKLQELLKKMRDGQVEWVVLEVTSHALVQHRIWGIPIHTAVMTNLSQDHLDYHQTMDDYAAAKAKLFKLAKQGAVLNHDDEWFEYFWQRSPANRFSYGVNEDTDVRLLKANLKPEGSKIQLKYGQEQNTETLATVDLKLTGKFNVYNALAAATVALSLNFSVDDVKTGLEQLAAVPGRMEAIEAGQHFKVLVDYAHTPDAMQKLFETLRPLTRGKLITVFGATGDRDKTKRPLMGAIAAKQTDVVIVTDDDPYTEKPAAIRKEIVAGTEHAHTKAEVLEIGDRHDAIVRAFQMAAPGDTVAILGLGHQQHRVIGTEHVPWDDRKVARELLQA